MEFLLYAWILFFTALAGGGLYVAYRVAKKLLAPYVARKKMIAQGLRNYRAMVGAVDHPMCVFCSASVDPRSDLYSEGLGWIHKQCYQTQVKVGIDHDEESVAALARAVSARVRNPR